jgi:hypothetical protein
MGVAEGALAAVEGVAQGARGALVSGEDGPAMRQRLVDARGQRGRGVHTPFIRFGAAEKRWLASQLVLAGIIRAGV